MSYRCQLCCTPVPPKTPKRRYIVYRVSSNPAVNGQIEREWDVCGSCQAMLQIGYRIADVVEVRRPKPVPVFAPFVPIQPIPPLPAPSLASELLEKWRGKFG